MPTMATDKQHRAALASRVLIGARVKGNTDAVADGFHRVRGQVRNRLARCRNLPMGCPVEFLRCLQFGHFEFDFVHDQNSGQEDVFYTSVRPLVHKLIEVNHRCSC